MGGRRDQASNRYILAVDDDPDISILVEQTLITHGFKVFAFTDPPIALEHLKANDKNCELVLSDIRMPGMNGYEFVMHVKKINSKVKVILMSAFRIQEKEFHNVLPDINVDAFVQKPFSIGQLTDVVLKMNT